MHNMFYFMQMILWHTLQELNSWERQDTFTHRSIVCVKKSVYVC